MASAVARKTIEIIPASFSGPAKAGRYECRPPIIRPTGLSEDFLDDLAVHVGEPEIPSLEAVREPCVIDAKTVEDGCLQVEHRHWIRSDVVAEVVGLADHEAAFDPAAGDPHAEVSRVMIAAVVGV